MSTFITPTLEGTIKTILEKGEKSLSRSASSGSIGEDSDFILAPYIYSGTRKSTVPAVENIGVAVGKRIDIATIIVIKIASIRIVSDQLAVNLITDGYIVPQIGEMPVDECIRDLVDHLPGYVDLLSENVGMKFTIAGMEVTGIPAEVAINATTRNAMADCWDISDRASLNAIIAAAGDDGAQIELFDAITRLPGLVNVISHVADHSG